jgi:N utilization substance protein B
MTKRSRAREVALQLLFQRDFNPQIPRADIEQFVKDRLRGDSLQSFCLSIYDGVLAHKDEIDQRISAAAENWRLHRMPAVDRNVLRLGAFELVFSTETPAPVAFDEAIELAKRYGSAESSAFINGVLDQLRKTATATAEASPPAAPGSAEA